MDLEEIPCISEELNVESSTINNSSQEPMEAETDEECIPSNPPLDFDTRKRLRRNHQYVHVRIYELP